MPRNRKQRSKGRPQGSESNQFVQPVLSSRAHRFGGGKTRGQHNEFLLLFMDARQLSLIVLASERPRVLQSHAFGGDTKVPLGQRTAANECCRTFMISCGNQTSKMRQRKWLRKSRYRACFMHLCAGQPCGLSKQGLPRGPAPRHRTKRPSLRLHHWVCDLQKKPLGSEAACRAEGIGSAASSTSAPCACGRRRRLTEILARIGE